MKLTIKGIKIIFLIVFLLISIGSLASGFYWIWMTTFGVSWGGGKITLLDLLWTWKGIFVLFVFSTVAFIGLIRPTKIGLIFGYSISIALAIYLGSLVFTTTVYDYRNNEFIELSYLFSLILDTTIIIGLAILLLIGLNKIRIQYFKFKSIDYGIIIALVITLLLSWYTMLEV